MSRNPIRSPTLRVPAAPEEELRKAHPHVARLGTSAHEPPQSLRTSAPSHRGTSERSSILMLLGIGMSPRSRFRSTSMPPYATPFGSRSLRREPARDREAVDPQADLRTLSVSIRRSASAARRLTLKFCARREPETRRGHRGIAGTRFERQVARRTARHFQRSSSRIDTSPSQPLVQRRF